MTFTFDAHGNFGYGTVLTVPSPANSGSTLVLASGNGGRFPSPVGTPYNITIGPAGTVLTPTNSEIVRVTVKSSDTLTITRTQESSVARTIQVGDQVILAPTKKCFTDIESYVNSIETLIQYYLCSSESGGGNTWSKPANGKLIYAICIGGGGGGGGGRKGATGTARWGGGGGSSGVYAARMLLAIQLGSTVAVNTGQGGVSGGGPTVSDTNGISGGAGEQSFFGAHLRGAGGLGGSGGSTTSGSGGPAPIAGFSAPGGSGGLNGGGAAPAAADLICSGGGGGGGGISTGNVAGPGGNGGTTGSCVSAAGALTGGSVPGGAGGNPVTSTLEPFGQLTGGGGGGAASTSGNGGAGGSGSDNYGFGNNNGNGATADGNGAGGGGGGAATNGVGNAGAGGAGTAGLVTVLTIF